MTETPETRPAQDESDAEKAYTREALYELAWSEPMLQVAARFGVSSSYMARIFTQLNIPRPKVGYWSRRQVGKIDPKPPLPEARAWEDMVWSPGSLPVKEQTVRPQMGKPLPKTVTPSESRPQQHALLRDVKGLFQSGRSSHEVGYLRPAKHLLPDILATKGSLEKVLEFANELFLSLEDKGHCVRIAPQGEGLGREEVETREKPTKNQNHDNVWSPGRPTVVYIGAVAIGLTVMEMSEDVEVRYVNGEYVRESTYTPPKRSKYFQDHSWTTRKNLPSGRLRLQAYSPYQGTDWKMQWQEAAGQNLTGQIKSIISVLEGIVPTIVRLIEEAEKQAQIEHEQWEAQKREWDLESQRRRAEEAQKASREELHQIITKWADLNRIEQFFKDLERRGEALEGAERDRLMERITRARDMSGSIDALDHFLRWRAPEER